MTYDICEVLGLFLIKDYKQNQIAQLSIINKSQKYKKTKNNCIYFYIPITAL